jgi:opacity protein-like surface antigen
MAIKTQFRKDVTMKKIIPPAILLCFFMGIGVNASAQVRFALGLKTGLGLSSFSVDPDPYGNAGQGITSSKSGGAGINIGAVAELMFGKMFAVALEPGYAQGSTKWELTQGQAKATDQRTISYLQIPILFRARFIEGNVRPYGFIGPNLGLVLSSKAKFTGFGNIQDGEYDVKSTTSSLDFGIAIGGGAEFNIAKQVSLTGDIRYNLGLSNLDNSTIQPGQTAGSAKSRAFVILFGVLFYLG